MNNTSKIILGITGALAAGVVIGLLVAPEKGSETRKKIRDTAGDLASRVTDLFNAGKEQFDNLKSKAKHTANDVVNS